MAKTVQEPIPYTLKAPPSGPGLLDPRTALLVWGIGSVILGLMVSVLLARGDMRSLVLLLLGVLGLACLSPLRGVYILMTFLPFMYFLRRQVLIFQEFESRDPILIFPAVTTAGMLFGAMIFRRKTLFHYLQRSPLLKCVALLGLWLAVEMVNPLQGSVLVGVAGAIYFLVPMAWCYFGLLLTREQVIKILKIVIAIGFITALYGLYQRVFGLSAVELYELRSKDFLKTFGGSNYRIMSTFSSLGDFSLYLMVASFLSLAYFWRSRRNFFLVLIAMLEIYTMLFMAVRTAFLLLIFSLVSFAILHGTRRKEAVTRGVLAVLMFVGIYAVLATYKPERIYDQQFSSNPYVVHTLSGITHPTQERSFQMRLANWKYIVTSTLFEYPLWGRGLGSTTTAAKRFEGGRPFEADSYFFELFYGSGLLAPLLFGLVVLLTFKSLMGLCMSRPDIPEYRIVAGLIAGAILGSLFGGAVRDVIVGPLIWLLIGWAAKETEDERAAALTAGPAT
jgi:hypothetical protein